MKFFAAFLVICVLLALIAAALPYVSCDVGERLCWVWIGLAFGGVLSFLVGWPAVIAE